MGWEVSHWFFIEQVPVNRTSKNQPAGSLEIKSVLVGQKEMENMILDNLFLAILGRCPAWKQRRIHCHRPWYWWD